MPRKYGVNWGETWSDAQIELECYKHQHPESEGGLGEVGHLRNAMMELWPDTYKGEAYPGVAKWRPEIQAMTWAWCNYRYVVVLGHASAAKTHTFGRIAGACYMANPFNTITTLTSTHLPGLRKRIWADLVQGLRSNQGGAEFYIRNHDLTVRPSVVPKEDKYIIEGISTDKGEDAVSKIQGNHSRFARHVVIDEADGTPKAIYDASANLMTDAQFRMAMLANPAKRFNELGNWAEPVQGWDNLDSEVDFQWETTKGGICLRLDGLQSANIVAGKVIFPWLIDDEYVRTIIQSHGKNSPRYWTFVRAWYPPDGTSGSIFSPSILDRAAPTLDFKFKPTPCCSFDPAFEGGDDASLTFGEFGPVGDTPFSVNITGQESIKVVTGPGTDPLDFLIAAEVMRICKDRDIEPHNFAMDITGAGRGVYAILQKEWSHDIVGVNFGGPVSDRPMRVEDPTPSKELYDRFVTELWFAAREFVLGGMVGGLDGSFQKLKEQLCAREYEMVNEKKAKIETKRIFKERLGYSPDLADSFTILIELLRRKGAMIGRATGSSKRDRHAMERAKVYSNVEMGGFANEID